MNNIKLDLVEMSQDEIMKTEGGGYVNPGLLPLVVVIIPQMVTLALVAGTAARAALGGR